MLRGFVTPFADLFVLAMQVRTACLNQTTAAPEFSFHWRTKQSGLFHLIFADVVFLFYKGDIPSIKLLFEGVAKFSNASGLHPNPGKSLWLFW